MKKWVWARRLLRADYQLIVKVYFLLHLSKWLIERRTLKEIVVWIEREAVKQQAISKEDLRTARKTARYTRKLARFVLFESKCYDKALTVKKILNQQGIPTTLLMGVKNSKAKGMEAHAWIACDEQWIIGGEVAQEYTLVRSFK